MSPPTAPTSPIATTPRPPYYAVIFSSTRNHHLAAEADSSNGNHHDEEYRHVGQRMAELAAHAEGYLGAESVRDGVMGLTVSYWKDLESIQAWKNHSEHLMAQEMGKKHWYSAYTTRICRVERDYSL
jgi:heme-degrading monooxygenase HmoA